MKTQHAFLSASLLLCLLSCKKENLPEQQKDITATSEEVFNSVSSMYHMKIGTSDFIDAKINNPWFPLIAGTVFYYVNKIKDDGETYEEHNTVTATYDTKKILGVSCRVVHDQIKVDGKLTEDTYDWYAQDRFGNVWYFGEDTKAINDDGSIDSSGSFQAGVNGALPGIVMLAHPEKHIGFTFYQEFSPGNALDEAQILVTDGTANVPYGSFTNCLVTKEFTALEPDDVENKYYSYGVGQVFSVQIKGGNEKDELVSISHY